MTSNNKTKPTNVLGKHQGYLRKKMEGSRDLFIEICYFSAELLIILITVSKLGCDIIQRNAFWTDNFLLVCLEQYCSGQKNLQNRSTDQIESK